MDLLLKRVSSRILSKFVSKQLSGKACFLISKTGAGIKHVIDQIRIVTFVSVTQSSIVVEVISGLNVTESRIFVNSAAELSFNYRSFSITIAKKNEKALDS